MVSFQKYSILEDLSDKKQYSGLISGMEWRVLDEPIRMYGFHYDSQKRLSRANYAHQMPMYGAESEDVGGFNTIYAYDDNGNITLLKRKGITNYIPDPGYYVYGDIDWLNMSYEGNRLKTVGEPTSISQAHGYKSLGEEFTYDAAGNVTYDGGKGADFKNYNALDLPTEVERVTFTGTLTGKVVNTYDASGTKWSTDHTYYNQGSHNQNIKYVNGLELLDNGQFVLHHEEGRYVSGVGESNYEYVISDHLGNGRVWFQDLDGDGDLSLDPANLEVKQVKHYYPFGMTMGIQSLQTYAPPTDRNQYNGIEFFEGLDYNMAFYRTLDPGIGRWLQVDPKAESFYGMSPYTAMGNNPMSIVDPAGDAIITGMLIGAAVGVLVNGINNLDNRQNFFDGWAKAAVIGGISGAVTAGIGNAFGGVGGWANEIGRGVAHAMNGGFTSEMQGGSFWQGALSGGLSSGIGSGIGALGGHAGDQLIGGGISGGIGSSIAGGNFFQGMTQGLLVGGLNHGMHSTYSYFKTGIHVKSTRAFLEDLGYNPNQVKQDVVKQYDGFYGRYYAMLKNENRYISGWSKQVDSRSGSVSWVSPTRNLKVAANSIKYGSFINNRGYALKFYPDRNNSIGIIRSGAAHYIEASFEMMDGAFRKATGYDNVIYNMHLTNAMEYLKYR